MKGGGVVVTIKTMLCGVRGFMCACSWAESETEPYVWTTSDLSRGRCHLWGAPGNPVLPVSTVATVRPQWRENRPVRILEIVLFSFLLALKVDYILCVCEGCVCLTEKLKPRSRLIMVKSGDCMWCWEWYEALHLNFWHKPLYTGFIYRLWYHLIPLMLPPEGK